MTKPNEGDVANERADQTQNEEDSSSSSSTLFRRRAKSLRDLIPEAFSDGRLDVEALRVAIGEAEPDEPGRYLFTWSGKEPALRVLKRPALTTLVPDREHSINFDEARHAFIDGENLEVLKLLYRAYFGRIRMMYIDPPYNTGRDFIYRDDWADPLEAYLRATGQSDEEGRLLTSSPETAGRFHSNWLTMMYPRLFLARQLLREDGAIFVSIDDNEFHHLRMIMNEIFGEENFIATVIWQKVYAPKNTARHFSVDHDYIVVYAKDAETWRPNLLPRSEEADARYSNPDDDPRGPWKPGDMTARNYYSEGRYEVTSPSGMTFRPTVGTYWRWSKDNFQELDDDGRIWWGSDGGNMPAIKRFLSEVKQGIVPQTLWSYEEVGHTQKAKKELLERVDFQETENVLDTVKPTALLRRMLRLATDPDGGDIVLDFFAGSATTADAVVQQNREDGGNRRFVCVQFPEPLPKPEEQLETISDIALARIRSALADQASPSDANSGDQLDLDSPDDRSSKTDTSQPEPEPDEEEGVRVYRMAQSHIERWPGEEVDGDPEEYLEQLEAFLDPLRDGWKPEPLLHELALREGLSLDSLVETAGDSTNPTIFHVREPHSDRGFFACLDDRVELEQVQALGLDRETLFICRDTALDDTAAANLALQCRLRTI